jgi:antitoxin CptB
VVNAETDQAVDYRWQCRRGMLELDLLLNNFIDKQVTQLDAGEHRVFTQLLNYPDQTLLDLLLGNTVSANDEINLLVNKIRSTDFDAAE